MEPPAVSISNPSGTAPEAAGKAVVPDADAPATLREVFLREEAPLLRYAYGLTGRRETAEDLVQEAFLRLHRHWQEVLNPRAWLFRSVHNLAVNHLRRSNTETDLESQPESAVPAPDPGDALGRMEAIGSLRLLVAELPPEDRRLIRLKYFHHYKYQEIARKTGLSAGNVGYRLHHLLKQLADSLRRLGVESPEG